MHRITTILETWNKNRSAIDMDGATTDGFDEGSAMKITLEAQVSRAIRALVTMTQACQKRSERYH